MRTLKNSRRLAVAILGAVAAQPVAAQSWSLVDRREPLDLQMPRLHLAPPPVAAVNPWQPVVTKTPEPPTTIIVGKPAREERRHPPLPKPRPVLSEAKKTSSRIFASHPPLPKPKPAVSKIAAGDIRSDAPLSAASSEDAMLRDDIERSVKTALHRLEGAESSSSDSAAQQSSSEAAAPPLIAEKETEAAASELPVEQPAEPSGFAFAQWVSDDFVRERSRLTALVAATDGQSRPWLHLGRFLLAHGMAEEAFAAMEKAVAAADIAPADAVPLWQFASLLARGALPSGIEEWAAGQNATGHPDAPVLAAMSAALNKDYPAAGAVLREAIARAGTYPPQLQRLLLPAFIETALAERRHGEALKAAAVMANIAAHPGEAAAAVFVEGEVARRRGSHDEAYKRFGQAAAMGGPWGARAELAAIDVGQKQGTVSSEEARRRLERVAVDWRGGEEEIQALKALAISLSDEELTATLRPLATLARRFPDDPRGREAAAKAEALLDNFYRKAEAGNVDVAQLVDVHATFGTEMGDEAVRAARHFAYARALKALGLQRAAETAFRRVKEMAAATPAAREAATESLAALLAARGEGDDAEALLRALAPKPNDRQSLIGARAALEADRPDDALSWFKTADLGEVEAAALRAEALWRDKKWTEAAKAYAKLLGEGYPLSDTDIARWTSAALAAGEPLPDGATRIVDLPPPPAENDADLALRRSEELSAMLQRSQKIATTLTESLPASP